MIGTRVDIPESYRNPLNQEKIGLMKRLLSYLQTLLLVCLMAGHPSVGLSLNGSGA